MIRHNPGEVYAGITAALIGAIVVSGWCWNWQNMTGITFMALRDACLGVWVVSGILLVVAQVWFLVIAVRQKRKGILLCASGILFIVAVFVFLLSIMPS